jgi:hypothetical protein
VKNYSLIGWVFVRETLRSLFRAMVSDCGTAGLNCLSGAPKSRNSGTTSILSMEAIDGQQKCMYASDLSRCSGSFTEDVNEVHTGLNDGERVLHICKYETVGTPAKGKRFEGAVETARAVAGM